MASLMKLALLSIAVIPTFSYPILSPPTILPRIDYSASEPSVPLGLRSESPYLEIGDYKLSELVRIGQGDYGIVFKGKAKKKLGYGSIDIAMKVCQEAAIASCKLEVKVLQELHGKVPGGIPEVYASSDSTVNDRPGFSFIMTLEKGGTLKGKSAIYSEQEKPEDKHSNLVKLWTTLEEIHDAGWAHRDIFSSNMAFSDKREAGQPFGPMVFLDFGQASDASRTTTPVGITLKYAAPEEVALINAQHYDRRVVGIDPKLGDVWSLGCITWQLIRGSECTWAKENENYNLDEEKFTEIIKDKLKVGDETVHDDLAKWFAGVLAGSRTRLTSKQAREQFEKIDAGHLPVVPPYYDSDSDSD
ncbi:Uu.00g007210.m01.CDS01 [Anthostomella pinea]|uniref:Uu.00g007210.m01.CDS01 n=1 Tax=Anthostomella pinea TaxID=933095 RepID=A0AAI8YME2_9PEZI|nr:Uu.00g007210.m01.CDS01 [Anthostomella pinea]